MRTWIAVVAVATSLTACVATAADIRQRAPDETFVVNANIDQLAEQIARTSRFGAWPQALFRTGAFTVGVSSEFEISGQEPVSGIHLHPTGTVELHAIGPSATRVELRLKRTIWGGYQADVDPIRDGIAGLAAK